MIGYRTVVSSSKSRNISSCKLIVNYIFKLLCLLGCLSHIIHSCVDYFKYETVAMYVVNVPLTQKIPHLTACFAGDSQQNVNATLLEQDLPDINFTGENETVHVNTSTVIAGCSMKNFTSGKLQDEECSSVFTTIKSIRLHKYTCYTWLVREDVDFSSLEISSTLDEKYTLYSFSLSSQLVHSDRLMLINHFEEWPYDQLLRMKYLPLNPASKECLIPVLYEMYQLIRLEPPYDTQCVHQHSPLCSTDDRSNLTICSRNLCLEKWTVTHSYKEDPVVDGSISISVRSLSAPVDLVTYSPAMQWSTFLMKLSSILGIWFALSIDSTVGSLVHSIHNRLSSSSSGERGTIESSQLQMKLLELRRISKAIWPDILFKDAHRAAINKVNESSWRRVTKLLIKIIVLLLFLQELSLFSIDYFQFRTRMNIEMNTTGPIKVPSTSFCFSAHEWFNLTKPNLNYEAYDEQMTQFTDKFNFTLQEIFDSVPANDAIIEKCRFRPGSHSSLVATNDCHKYFRVSKFYQSDFICYFFTPRVDLSINIGTQIKGDNLPSIIYSIAIAHRPATLNLIQPIVSHGLPKTSRFLAPRLEIAGQRTQLMILTHVEYSYQNLPAPYDTMCLVGNQDCLVKCMNLSRFSLLSYSDLHHSPVDQSFLDYNRLKDTEIAQNIRFLDSHCMSSCQLECKDRITKTLAEIGYSTRERLEFALAVPDYPAYQFSAVPIHTLYDFLYELICSASFWIGFSFLGFIELLLTFKQNPKTSSLELVRLQIERHQSAIVRRLKVPVRVLNSKRIKWRFLRRVKRLIWLIALTVGFGAHSIITTDYYFRYPTLMDTRLKPESNFDDLKVYACITIDQLDLQGNNSISKIWASSPPEDHLILECGIRGISLPKLKHLPRTLQERIMPHINSSALCRSMFGVKKLITLGMVCYKIQTTVEMSHTSLSAKNHIGDSRALHYFTLSQELSKYELTVVMAQWTSHASFFFPVPISKVKPTQIQWSFLEHAKSIAQLLPYPYQIGEFKNLHQLDCEKRCIHSGILDTLGIFSSYGEIDASIEINHETFEQSMSPGSITIKTSCFKRCSHIHSPEMQMISYFSTTSYGPFDEMNSSRANGSNTLWVCGSDFLVPHTKLYPAVRLIDLILCIGSLYALWFGLSAIDIVDLIFTRSTERASVLDLQDKLDQLNLLIHSHHHKSRRLNGFKPSASSGLRLFAQSPQAGILKSF